MADGTTKPISDVAIGDQVKATDPATGETAAKPVTTLHLNRDRDLTTLTLAVAPGVAAVLDTTPNHPVWDATTEAWTGAGHLTEGESAATSDDGRTLPIIAVDTRHGNALMHDLTIADTHTYYVLAGDQPVLVHNCGTTDFYTVQGADDAARLGSGGHPFPTAPERAHFGPGVYAWGNHAEAVAYAANKPGAQIMKFTVDNKALAGLRQAHVGGMTDDAATAFMERNSLLWGGDASHGLDYISRPTARGTEHFFSSNIFEMLGFG